MAAREATIGRVVLKGAGSLVKGMQRRTGDEEKKGKAFEEMNSKLKADIRKLVEKNTALQVLCCFSDYLSKL